MMIRCAWCGAESALLNAETEPEEISHTICSECEVKIYSTKSGREGWHFEIYNPQRSNEWHPLFEIEADQLAAAEELRKELNKINAPILLRIVPATDPPVRRLLRK
jgi:hypothetical protein